MQRWLTGCRPGKSFEKGLIVWSRFFNSIYHKQMGLAARAKEAVLFFTSEIEENPGHSSDLCMAAINPTIEPES